MVEDKVRVAVIGLNVGLYHLREYLKIPDVEVVALCDVDAQKLKDVSSKYGVARTYTDYKALLDDPSVDAVSVVLPNYLHGPVSTSALESGKHVLCEKPLASSLPDGESIVKAAEKSGKVAMVPTNFVWMKEAAYTRKLLEDGFFGEVYYGYNCYMRQVGSGIPVRSTYFRKQLSGGGALIDNGFHFVDLNWYLMGCPRPVSAFGATYAEFGPRGKGFTAGETRGDLASNFDTEDFAVGVIRFKNGASMVVENAWAAYVEKELMATRVCGTEGGASIWPFYVTKEEEGKTVAETPDLKDLRVETKFEHFINCIRGGKKPTCSVQQGFMVLKMLFALYESAETGKLVKVT